MNKLIALSGDKGSGKSTVAKAIGFILFAAYREDYSILSFAEPLRHVVAAMTNCSAEDLLDAEFKESDSPIAKPEGGFYTYRELMQVIGDKMRELNPDIFVDHLFRDASPLQDFGYCIIIDDLRLEFTAIRERGGVIIRIERPGLANTDTHISETASRQEKYDYTIVNDGTLDQLREKVRVLVDQLQSI